MSKILHIASLIEAIGQKAPGGAEQVVLTLAKEQSKNNKVAIIAASGSKIHKEVEFIDLGIKPGDIEPVNISNRIPAFAGMTGKLAGMTIEEESRVFAPIKNYLEQEKDNISLIHNHSYDYFPLFELNSLDIPIVHTLHLPPIVPWINKALQDNQPFPTHVKYITVSETCAKAYQKETNFNPEVIYNGIDTSKVPFNNSPQEIFLFVGRISPEKGLHSAIKTVAHQAKKPLRIIGRVYDQDYFDLEIKPLISNQLITYLGFCTQEEVLYEMSQAKALIFPIEWQEPFGLVLIESLATGTPVIATEHGAVKEIIKDQENGLLIKNADSIPQALEQISKISRSNCRKSVEEGFSLEKTLKKYAELYESIH